MEHNFRLRSDQNFYRPGGTLSIQEYVENNITFSSYTRAAQRDKIYTNNEWINRNGLKIGK